MKRLSVLFLAAMIFTGCGEKKGKNLSTADALNKYGHSLKNKLFFVFPETRDNPVKWFDSIPETKLQRIIRPGYFAMKARPGEIFIYQLGIWALNSDIRDLQVDFSDMKGKIKVINASAMTCYNLGGTDFRGNQFSKHINIPKGRVQDLWIGIDLDNVVTGTYRGVVTITGNGEKQVVPVLLKVYGDPVKNHGYNEGADLSRLNWLNSTVGMDTSVTRGYAPVLQEANRISISGRYMEIGETGLPSSVFTSFSPSNQSLTDKAEPIVSRPFRFIIEKTSGEIVRLLPGQIEYSEKNPSAIVWKVLNTSPDIDLEVKGRMEFDGYVEYSVKLTAKNNAEIKDIRLEVPFMKDKATYIMGLGHEGGTREGDWKWKWDISKNQDMVWLGAVNGGLRIKLKGVNYVRPLINVYYKYGPLKLPPSWGNDNKGGVDITEFNGEVLLNAYSGGRSLKSGDVLDYNFELLITPFRVIDRHVKFGDRYYHGGGIVAAAKIDSALKAGANVLNIHHAEDIYPFINYPYLDANTEAIRQLAENAHKAGIRLKLYYTTREFTKNLPEFWAFNSLNGEIVYPGPGNDCKTVINPDGPKEWYVKNLRENYIPAWYNEIKEGKFKGETDLSVISTPDSRLNNFYVAGLDWMVQNLGIDGVYIDDSALDRYTLMRARKIIDRYRPEGRMDLHSWNHFNESAGFTNCLNLYMDLLPYFDLLWIGEGRNYDRAPDHWLIEVSGIPFGLPGQMLEGGGNPWRGMVYGITNRAGYLGISPSSLWKFWDEYKIENKPMIGYWEDTNPVKINNPLTKASLYRGDDESVISIANWSDTVQVASVRINWQGLGLDPALTDIFIPEIKDFQTSQIPALLENISIPAQKGYLIVLKKRNN
jgi:hypothetical protein